jgi:integrase
VLSLVAKALEICRTTMPDPSWDVLDKFFSAPHETKRPALLRSPEGAPRTSLEVDGDVAKRLANTVRAEVLHEFDQRLRSRRPSPDDRARLELACSDFARAIRLLVADNDPRLGAAAALVARADYRCLLRTRSREARLSLVRAVNCELQRLATTLSEVVGGLTTIDHAMPPRQEMLPLAIFGGTTIEDCHKDWLRRSTPGYSANRKAIAVVRGMSMVLRGQAVEHLTPRQVREYYGLLTGLHPNTAYGYLTTLMSLVKRRAPSAALQAIRELWPSHMQRAKLRIGRAALEEGELGTFLAAVFNDRALKTHDRVVVALLALTGARLEEICTLRADSLQWNGEYWTVRIELSTDEKARLERIAADHGLLENPKYKNLATLRTVPVFADAIAGLHEQLLKLSSQPGFLFKQLSTAQSTGRRAGAFGQRVNRRIRELFGPEKTVVVESLRGTVVTQLSETDVSEDLARAFVGHAPRDIHSEHYVKPTPKRLAPAAREVRSFVLRALQGKDYMRLAVDYEPWRRVLKRKPDVMQENLQAIDVQQPSLDADLRQPVLPAESDLQATSLNVPDSALTAPTTIDSNPPDLDQYPVHQEVGAQRSTACAGKPRHERVRGFHGKRHAIPLEHPRHDEFCKASDRPSPGRKPRRAPRRPLAHFAEQSLRACRGRDGPFGAGPRLEKVELAASAKEVLESSSMATKLPLGAGQFEYPSQAPLLAQHVGPSRVGGPDVAGRPDTQLPETTSVFIVAKTPGSAIGEPAFPAETLSYFPMHAEGEGPAVGRAVGPGPPRERVDTQWPDEGAPVFDGPAPVLVRANSGTHRLRRRDGRQPDGKTDARNGFDDGLELNGPVPAPNAAGVARQPVVDFLRHGGAAECLERMSKGVKDDPRVFDTAALGRPKISTPPLREISAAVAKLVGRKVRKQPLLPGSPPLCDIRLETASHDFGMDRHEPARRSGLDPLPLAGIVDAKHQTAAWAVDDIVDAELAQLFEPCAGGQAENGQPRARLPAPGPRPPSSAIHGRTKDGFKLRRTELTARNLRHTRPWHPQTPCGIDGEPPGVALRLQHGADEAELLADRRRRQPVAEQGVAESGNVDATERGERLADAHVEHLGRAGELHQRSLRTPRGQVAPVLERLQHRFGMPCRSRRHCGRRRRCRWHGVSGHRVELLVNQVRGKPGQPFRGKPEAQLPSHRSFLGLEVDPDQFAIAAA